MASDYTPTNVQTGFQQEIAINQNFADIKLAMDKLLNRQLTPNNAMGIDLDLGGFNIINLPAPTDPTHPVRLTDVNALSVPDVIQTIPFEVAITIDPNTLTVGDLTLTGNTTIFLDNTTGTLPTDGKPLLLRIRQDGVGSHTVTFITPARFSVDLPAPIFSTAANSLDYVLFRYNATDDRFDMLAVNRGYV